ncbi:MAG: ABC transporter substrate-binding protein [Gammaproteobacteria bacterium]|nr:ABC transporter substrate-binding protein [Gammaproteobacteria bacterium]
MEGLTRYDVTGQLVPGVAEDWEIRADGATFHLREEARWSDGEPVTAHDFVFAWRNVVDPANASEYAFITYGIENAEAISAGDLPVESSGCRGGRRPPTRGPLRSPHRLFRQAGGLRHLLPGPRGLLPRPGRSLRRRRGEHAVQRTLHHQPLGPRRPAEHEEEPGLLGCGQHLPERHQPFLHHQRHQRRAQPVQGRPHRPRRPRLGDHAERPGPALAHPELQRRFHLVHRVQPPGGPPHHQLPPAPCHGPGVRPLGVRQPGDRHPGQPAGQDHLPVLADGCGGAPAAGDPAAGAGDRLRGGPPPARAGEGGAGRRRDSLAGPAHRRLAGGEQAGRVPADHVERDPRPRHPHRQADLQAAAGEDDRRRVRHGRRRLGAGLQRPAHLRRPVRLLEPEQPRPLFQSGPGRLRPGGPELGGSGRKGSMPSAASSANCSTTMASSPPTSAARSSSSIPRCAAMPGARSAPTRTSPGPTWWSPDPCGATR